MMPLTLRCWWPSLVLLSALSSLTYSVAQIIFPGPTSGPAKWVSLPDEDSRVSSSLTQLFIRDLEDQCIGVGMILNRADLTCYELNSSGPCEAGQWFVLDKATTHKAKCEWDNCLPETVEYRMTCASLGVQGPCSQGEIMMVDVYGKGECDSGIVIRTLFNLPCASGYAMDVEGHCMKLHKRLRVSQRRGRRAQTLTGPRLISFLRARFGR